MKNGQKILLIVILVLILDQALKIWVKTHMEYGEEINILGLDWALIHFVENNGMAFGLSLGGVYGKLALSIFRILAVVILSYFLYQLNRQQVRWGVLACFALILAGATGNILDSVFYGVLFSESPYHGGLAEFMPEHGGYAGFLQGKVVDMFYFPMFRGYWPEWMPFVGGERYLFFKPVFNIADVAISAGVFNLLVFQRSFFLQAEENADDTLLTPSAAELETSDLTPTDDNTPEDDNLPKNSPSSGDYS